MKMKIMKIIMIIILMIMIIIILMIIIIKGVSTANFNQTLGLIDISEMFTNTTTTVLLRIMIIIIIITWGVTFNRISG